MSADEHREAMGFLTVAATEALGDGGVVVLDPRSTLVSPHATIGAGTVLYLTAILQAHALSTIERQSACHPPTR